MSRYIMTWSEAVEAARREVAYWPITDSTTEYRLYPSLYLVDDISEVVTALAEELYTDATGATDGIADWLDSMGIEWQ